jgi:HlyD family secretion protein
MRKLTIATAVSIAAAGIFAALQLTEQSDAQDPTVAKAAQNAPDKGVVEGKGTIDSAFSVPLVNKVPGTTTILWLVPNGSAVQKGDDLFELDDSSLREQMQVQQIKMMQAQATAAQAEEKLKLHALEMENSLIAAKASLEVAEKSQASVVGEGGELDLKQRELNRELKLLQDKIELIENRPKNQLEADHIALQYELTLLDLRNQLKTVQEQLQHLNDHVRPLAAARHDGEVKIAETHFKRQQAVGEFQTAQLKAGLEAARRPIEVEQQRLEELEQSVENCRVVAPRDGTVVYANSGTRRSQVVAIAEGVTLRERQKVMTLYDPENRLVRMRVHKSQLDDLKVGQSAKVRVDAFPDRVFSGTVVVISDSPERNRFPSDGELYSVVINVEKPQPELKPGMTCDVTVDVGE